MLSGLILAGGRSSRMGRDKAGLVLSDGSTLLARQANLLRSVGVTSLFASVRPETDCSLPEVTRVADAVVNAGPLAGIAAGLRAARTGLVIVLAVDMPAVEAGHLRRLIDLTTPERGVVPMQTGQCEPLAAIYPAALADSADEALRAGKGAVQAWARAEAARGHVLLWDVPADWSGVFRSWNTPADLPPPAR